MTDRPQHPGTPEERAERLAAIKARVEAATPGPWKPGIYRRGSRGWVVFQGEGNEVPPLLAVAMTEVSSAVEYAVKGGAKVNAEFIAHARQDVPDLLAEVAALERERDEAREGAARLRAALIEADNCIRRPPPESLMRGLSWTDSVKDQIAAALAGTAAPRPQEEKQNDV